MFSKDNVENAERTTGGLAQAGQWLARKFLQIWKYCARPNGSEAPPSPSRFDVICNMETVYQDKKAMI